MATWQVQFAVYPLDHYGGMWSWRPEKVTNLKTAMAEILPLGESWSKDQILWGDVEGHCFEVWHTETGQPEEASLRLDARRGDLFEVANRCFDMFTLFELTMVATESGERLWAKTQLVASIQHSRAFAFVSNSSRYVRDYDPDPT